MTGRGERKAAVPVNLIAVRVEITVPANPSPALRRKAPTLLKSRPAANPIAVRAGLPAVSRMFPAKLQIFPK